MDKLNNLQEWLTLDNVLLELSSILERKVTEADVLRLALDGHLKLSVRLVNSTVVKWGNNVPIDEAKYHDVIPSDGEEPWRYYEGTVLYKDGLEHSVIEWNEIIGATKGTYDLTMFGNEQIEIEKRYLSLIGVPKFYSFNYDGPIVAGLDGQLYQLQENLEEDETIHGSKASLEKINRDIASYNIKIDEANELRHNHKADREVFLKDSVSHPHTENFQPASGLPKDWLLVVRNAVLREFKKKITYTPSCEETESPTVTDPGHLNHNLKMQQRANEIADELIKSTNRIPTRDKVAKELAKELGMTVDTVVRRIRAVWKNRSPSKYKNSL